MMNIDKDSGNITLRCTDIVKIGDPVKMLSSGTVTRCTPGDSIAGIAENVINGYASIKLSGYITMMTDDKFDVGYQRICAGFDQKVCVSHFGREYLVVETGEGYVGFILK